MKNRIKFFGIIAFVAIIGFSSLACSNNSTSDGDSGETKTVTGTANFNGNFSIQHNGGEDTGTVKITTDLLAPNNSFTLSFKSSKEIKGLEKDQKVKVTISVSSGKIMHASGYDGGVGFQTYER